MWRISRWRAVTPGLGLQLQDVGFAAIVGGAQVTSGGGAQHLWGDGAAQAIALGAGDDLVSGGGGNDTVDRGDVLPGFANSDEEIALVRSIGTSIQTA